MGGDAQGGNSVLYEPLVAQAIELSFAGNLSQLIFESGEVERLVEILAETLLDSVIGVFVSPHHLNRIDPVERFALLRHSFIEVVLPLGVIMDRIGQEHSGLTRSRLVPELNKFMEPAVVVDGKTLHVDRDFCVRHSERIALVLRDHDIDSARQDANQRFELTDVSRWKLKFNRNHHVRIHALYGFDRNVLHHTAVRKHAALPFYGREDSWNRHGGAHGLPQ